MKAVIYTRCENNERPHDSIKQQLIDCEEYAEENELEIVDHYIDIAPGCMERGRRAGLELLLEDSKKRAFDIVIVAEMSSLSHCYFEMVICLRKLQENGVKVCSARAFPSDCFYPVEECYKMAFEEGRAFV